MTWKIATLPEEDARGLMETGLDSSPAARAAHDALTAEGGHVYIVGGAVRDAYLGKSPKDVDLLVTGLSGPDVQGTLARISGAQVKLTGLNFGVYRLLLQGDEVEVALPRTERSTGGGHRDFEVEVDHRLPVETDLGRRDFTANAMAYSPLQQQVIDPHNGLSDIGTNTLRVVSPQAFDDDPLRIVRALVAYARHDLEPDQETLLSMQEHADKIRHLPGDRIKEELEKLLSAPNPVEALQLAHRWGILRYLLPEVDACFGFNQYNPNHDLDVGQHLLAVLHHICELTDDPELRLAALLHDIGKPDSFWMDDNGVGHFYEHPDHPESANHADLGADKARAALRRLRYSNDQVKRIGDLVQHHMFPDFRTPTGARRLVRKLNGDFGMAHDLVRLHRADVAGKGLHRQKQDTQMHDLLDQVRHQPVTVKALAIDGRELMALGIPQGPIIGQINKLLLDDVEHDPSLNTKEQLTELALRHLRSL